MAKCQGTCKNGAPCAKSPRKNERFCWRHGDQGGAASDNSEGSGAHARARAGEDWDRAAWLAAYEATLMVSAACREIGISPSTAYLERQRNESFAGAWDSLRTHVVRPSLEEEAYRRAVHGVEKRVVSAGRDLGTEMAYSDTLLVTLLKANIPEKYRDRVDVAHSGGVQSDVQLRVDLRRLTDEQLDQLDAIEDALKEPDPPA